jgi:hypothetical protein
LSDSCSNFDDGQLSANVGGGDSGNDDGGCYSGGYNGKDNNKDWLSGTKITMISI